MLELLLLAGFAGVAGAALRLIWTKGLTSRRFNANPELPAPEPRRMVIGPAQPLALTAGPSRISPEVQAELDQTPEWWDRQFHKALEASGADVTTVDDEYEYEERSWDGRVAVIHRHKEEYIDGCLCLQCGRLTGRGKWGRL